MMTRALRRRRDPAWWLGVVLAACTYTTPAWAQEGLPSLDAGEVAELRGSYGLPSGDVAVVTGWVGHPSWPDRLFLWRGEERHRLRPLGDGRMITAAGDTLEVIGGPGGVRGIEWRGAAGEQWFMPRLPLYTEEEVTFESDGVRLAGTVLIPRGVGPHPGVVFVHGSGPDWRESYRDLADYFARYGIAALIYDKRGIGGSEGDWRQMGFDALADDALAARRHLREPRGVDASRVGLWGISQGGWVVPLAASRSRDVAFIIPVSASGVRPAEQELWRVGNNLLHRELSGAAVRIGMKTSRLYYSLKPLHDRGTITLPEWVWFRSLDPWLDPVAIWERVEQPVLGVWGEVDGLVPTRESVEIARAALEAAGNPRWTLHVFPRAEHNIFQAREGFQHERLGRIAYAEGYREAMTAWVHGLGRQDAEQIVTLPTDPAPTRLGWHGPGRGATPLFGRAAVQLPVVVLLVAVFLWTSLAAVLEPPVRLARKRPAPAPRLRRLRASGGAAGALALTAMAGWALTAAATGLEGGTPFLLGHPLPLAFARLAAPAAGLAFGVLSVTVLATWREGRLGLGTRLAYSGITLLGVLFLGWSWYWHLLPWT